VLALSASQLATLESLRARGFEIVAFPAYASYVGVRWMNCAALLQPAGDGFKIFGVPSWLIAGSFSVLISEGDQQYFVWKKTRIPATSARLAELAGFRAALAASLAAGDTP